MAKTFFDAQSEIDQASNWIQDIVDLGRRRLAGSDTELRAQQHMAEWLQDSGFEIHWQEFETNQSLYSLIGAHAFLGVFFALFAPWFPLCSAAGLLFVALSHWLDVTKRAHLLRKLFPKALSQNLIALAPNHKTAKKHVVLMGHADASYTGFMFSPFVTKGTIDRPQNAFLNYLTKGGVLPNHTMIALAGANILYSLLGAEISLFWIVVWLILASPSFVAGLLCADMVRRNGITDGASDNLSGTYASIRLGEVLQKLDPDVAVSVVVTGAEEAGTMGAFALVDDLQPYGWTKENAVFLALDTVTNGDELHAILDGEFRAMPLSDGVVAAVQATNQQEPDGLQVKFFEIPGGASDVAVFRRRGYDAVAFARTNSETGASLHYHQMSDTLENMSIEELPESMNWFGRFIENYTGKQLA